MARIGYEVCSVFFSIVFPNNWRNTLGLFILLMFKYYFIFFQGVTLSRIFFIIILTSICSFQTPNEVAAESGLEQLFVRFDEEYYLASDVMEEVDTGTGVDCVIRSSVFKDPPKYGVILRYNREIQACGKKLVLTDYYYKWTSHLNAMSSNDISDIIDFTIGTTQTRLGFSLRGEREPLMYYINPYLIDGIPENKIISKRLLENNLNMPQLFKGISNDGVSIGILVIIAPNPIGRIITNNSPFEIYRYDERLLVSEPTEYNSGFIRVSDQTIIDGEDFIRIPESSVGAHPDSYYYPLLVVAPRAHASPNKMYGNHWISSQSTAIAWKGEPNENSKSTILFLPAPTIFYHGIWADQSSFSTMEWGIRNLLPWNDARWKQYVKLFRGSYDSGLAFHDKRIVDTVKGQINNIVREAHMEDGILTSRVNMVVHSMGGLMARAMTMQPYYLNWRNRNKGMFFNVVTINTPHQGSLLAPYLISKQNERRKPKGILDDKIWKLQCGTSLLITVANCFGGSLNMPIHRGAVHSLFPPSTNATNPIRALRRLSDPSLMQLGLKWSVISSESDNSFIERRLNDLIAAIYPFGQNPSKIDRVLRTKFNDAIVAVESQRGGARVPTGVRYAHFRGLSHTGILGITDNKVLESDAVISKVACYLRDTRSNACSGPSARLVIGSASTREPILHEGGIVFGGLEPSSAPMGALSVTVPALSALRVTGVYAGHTSSWGDTTSRVTNFTVGPSGVSFVLPISRFGDVAVTVAVAYANGEVHQYQGQTRVPFAVDNIQRVHADVIKGSLFLTKGDTYTLTPMVDLKNGLKEVNFGGTARYSVISDPNDALRVNGTSIQTLRAGLAVVRLQIGNAKDDVTVIVED